MKALILNNKVVQIANKEFPVSKQMSWVDCDDSVKVGFEFIDDQFKDTTPLMTPEQIRDQLKTEGEIYPNTNYKVSFTSEDAIAMLQVKAAFEFGETDTNIEFYNGTIMPMKSSEFLEFAEWFTVKRNSFFK